MVITGTASLHQRLRLSARSQQQGRAHLTKTTGTVHLASPSRLRLLLRPKAVPRPVQPADTTMTTMTTATARSARLTTTTGTARRASLRPRTLLLLPRPGPRPGPPRARLPAALPAPPPQLLLPVPVVRTPCWGLRPSSAPSWSRPSWRNAILTAGKCCEAEKRKEWRLSCRRAVIRLWAGSGPSARGRQHQVSGPTRNMYLPSCSFTRTQNVK